MIVTGRYAYQFATLFWPAGPSFPIYQPMERAGHLQFFRVGTVPTEITSGFSAPSAS
jgi:hypothetical protein